MDIEDHSIVKPRAADSEDALQEWIKQEIKQGPFSGYDFGKFAFSVSTGTAGLVLTLAKLTPSERIDLPLTISLILFVISICVSLDMTRPRAWQLKQDHDLWQEYKLNIRRITVKAYSWFLLWLIASLIGFVSLFSAT